MNKIQYLQKILEINKDEIYAYGEDKFKIDLKINQRLKDKAPGKLILVSAINPTSSGEGKTTVSIGLAQGFKKIKKNVMLALREPSMGPVFGMKGGATGGGASELEPAMDINMHFNGDIHAMTAANNLLSAIIDNHIHFGNQLKIKTVYWQRALDVNDRSLRVVHTTNRQDSFTITAASEMMAIVALAHDFKDLKSRLDDILIGVDEEGKDLFVRDLGCKDSLALILKDAIRPNLVFAKEMVPAFVHAGPFANIAHGCNSVIATNMALKLADYVITEAGFGADLGMEKFLHIKQPHLVQEVGVVVIVATIKALKLHGGISEQNLDEKHIAALEKGLENLEKHIENVRSFGLNSVIALNRFSQDLEEEITYLKDWAKKKHVRLGLSEGYSLGGDGTKDLAKLVISALEEPKDFHVLYENDWKHVDKISKVAKVMYGAKSVHLSKKALLKLEKYKDLKYPICIAKTPLSLSGDPKLKGRPRDFILEINDVKISNGAKLIVCLTKGINTMPGLNEHPRALDFRISDEGVVLS